MLSLKQFESRLVGREAQPIAASRHAAVAALLRFAEGPELEGPEVLLMRRAEAEGDRWSGQVCLPGGKEEEGDQDLRSTAQRETHEELGFELGECSRYLGAMDALPAMARGRRLSTSISPFVFVQTASPTLNLGDEAAHAFWLPLGRAARGEFDSKYDYRGPGGPQGLPCWRFESEVVWGLTFNMLESLLQLVRSPRG